MPEYVSEALSLFAESHETMKKRSSEKSNLAGISGDHEDPNVIAFGVGRKHKEADLPRVIGLWSPDNLLSVSESDFDCPDLPKNCRMLGIMVFGFAIELPNKEDRLQVLQRNLYCHPLKWVLLGKKIESVFYRRKVRHVAFSAGSSQETDNYLAQLIESFRGGSHKRSFRRCVVIRHNIPNSLDNQASFKLKASRWKLFGH